ncbi:MAG: cytochrome c [Lacunisphaera sp.]|nr:cytochrome c [Lacunisphaera sp.]
MTVRVLALLALLAALAACARREPAATASAKPAAPLPDDLPSDLSAKTFATAEALAKEGAALFTQNCATCHMADGGGVPYLQPSIKGSAGISNPDPQLFLSLILRGSAVLDEGAKAYENDMAPQDHLSDTEIAAVATYVRQRFAAQPITKPVTPADVAIARARPGLPP